MADLILRPIGVVRSAIRERKSMPSLGAPARVEVFAEYVQGLYRLEKHSHFWVLAWLEGAERDVLQVLPRRVAEPAPEGLHGVFAVRSPVRPNPVGLTLARLLGSHGAVLEFDRLDFIDGTPVIDLKPYFVARDMVFSALNLPIGRPPSREALRETLLAQAINFHGERCPDLELAVDVLTDFRDSVLELNEPLTFQASVPLGRPHLADAVMGITRTSPGRGTLAFHDADLLGCECETAAAVYELLPAGFRLKDLTRRQS